MNGFMKAEIQLAGTHPVQAGKPTATLVVSAWDSQYFEVHPGLMQLLFFFNSVVPALNVDKKACGQLRVGVGGNMWDFRATSLPDVDFLLLQQ